jgi:hypothetical protein
MIVLHDFARYVIRDGSEDCRELLSCDFSFERSNSTSEDGVSVDGVLLVNRTIGNRVRVDAM